MDEEAQAYAPYGRREELRGSHVPARLQVGLQLGSHVPAWLQVGLHLGSHVPARLQVGSYIVADSTGTVQHADPDQVTIDSLGFSLSQKFLRIPSVTDIFFAGSDLI